MAGGGFPLRAQEMRTDVIAVEPPRAALTGRVLQKDGVTPVPGARLELESVLDGQVYSDRSSRSGRYKTKLTVGQYRLRITRLHEIYVSPSLYRVPAGGTVEVDFLLLRDFEPSPDDPPPSADATGPAGANGLPGPPREPAVVGSVVDMVRSSEPERRVGRWIEVLGFLGSLLAVGLAAN